MFDEGNAREASDINISDSSTGVGETILIQMTNATLATGLTDCVKREV